MKLCSDYREGDPLPQSPQWQHPHHTSNSISTPAQAKGLWYCKEGKTSLLGVLSALLKIAAFGNKQRSSSLSLFQHIIPLCFCTQLLSKCTSEKTESESQRLVPRKVGGMAHVCAHTMCFLPIKLLTLLGCTVTLGIWFSVFCVSVIRKYEVRPVLLSVVFVFWVWVSFLERLCNTFKRADLC